MPTFHLLIKGKVQGVFYRATAKEVAKKLNISGWIKNTKEGNVEAMATGKDEQLQQFVIWCKKGPANAEVDEVRTMPQEEIKFDRFEIMK